MPTKTLQDILNVSYSILKQRQGATAYPVDLMTQFIDGAQKSICSGTVIDLQAPNVAIQKQGIQFLDATAFYNSSAYLYTLGTAIVGSTTLGMSDTSNIPASGFLIVAGNVISYTGTKANSITGIPVSGAGSILYPFKSGEICHQVYALPADFEQAVRAIFAHNNRLKNIDYRDINSTTITDPFVYNFFQSDFFSTRLQGQYYYTLISSQYLLPIIPSVSGEPIRFDYQKGATTLALSTDIVTIPDTYAMNTIPYIAVAEMMYNRGEVDEAIRLNSIGVKNIKAMYKKYQQGKNELQYGTRVTTSRDYRFPNV